MTWVDPWSGYAGDLPSPAEHPCGQCALVLPHLRALRRHEQLDHTAAPDGLLLVELLERVERERAGVDPGEPSEDVLPPTPPRRTYGAPPASAWVLLVMSYVAVVGLAVLVLAGIVGPGSAPP
jgi:hypothetical protein